MPTELSLAPNLVSSYRPTITHNNSFAMPHIPEFGVLFDAGQGSSNMAAIPDISYNPLTVEQRQRISDWVNQAEPQMAEIDGDTERNKRQDSTQFRKKRQAPFPVMSGSPKKHARMSAKQPGPSAPNQACKFPSMCGPSEGKTTVQHGGPKVKGGQIDGLIAEGQTRISNPPGEPDRSESIRFPADSLQTSMPANFQSPRLATIGAPCARQEQVRTTSRFNVAHNRTDKTVKRHEHKRLGRVPNAELVAKHPVLPGCHCTKLCAERFAIADRREINQAFWNRDFSGRRAFLDKYASMSHCKPFLRPSRFRQNVKRRRITIHYSLPDEDRLESVCKQMFLHTLGLRTDGMLTSFIANRRNNGAEISMRDARGKGRTRGHWLEDNIRRHIASLHPQISHYTRQHAPCRRYLDSRLSIRQLWRLYKETYGQISYEKYWKIFKGERITFGRPIPDQCDSCLEAKQHRVDRGPHSLAECNQCMSHSLHLAHASRAREHYQDETGRAWPNQTGIYAVDMQKILLLPMMPTKRAFFTSRLVCFNETFASLKGELDICMVWHEGISGGKGADLASVFEAFIRRQCHQKDFVFWLDNCCGQNKNWALFSTMIQLVNSADGPNSISLNYFEPGHTYMKADAVHGHIAQKLKRDRQVTTFSDLLSSIRHSQHRILAVPLSISDFREWSSLKAPKATCPKLQTIRAIRVSKGQLLLFFKTDLASKQFRECHFIELGLLPAIPAPKLKPRGLNAEKHATIMKQLVPLMPSDKREFWRTIPLSEQPDLLNNFE